MYSIKMSDFVKMELEFIKPAVAGATAYAIDKMYFKEANMNKSLMFAGSVATGIFVGGVLGSYAPDFNLGGFASGKAIESRILEISFGSGLAYTLNKYVLKNDLTQQDLMKRLGTIVLADIAGEYATDYMNGRPLSIFE